MAGSEETPAAKEAPIGDKERLVLVMEEYKALNAELLQRNTVLVQVGGISLAAMVALTGTMLTAQMPAWAYIVPLFGVGIVGAGWKVIDADARKVCLRLIEIENYVKELSGEERPNFPLSYQRRFGILARGYASRWGKQSL